MEGRRQGRKLRTPGVSGRVPAAPAVAALVLSGAIFGPGLRAQGLDTDSLDVAVERIRAEVGVPGIALAVVRGDSVLHLRGYGVRSIEAGEPVGPSTLFAIGSATKAFTATLAGLLVDEAALSWDDRVADHLPRFMLPDAYPTAEITLRDLLAHRSGLPTANLMWLPNRHPADTLIWRLRGLEPAAGFRSTFTYQNVLYLAAGRVLETVSGRSWVELLRERILLPLRMNDSNASVDALAGRADVAVPHVWLDGAARAVSYRELDDVAPAGAINASARDLVAWLRFLLSEGESPNGERLIDSATLRETWTPQIVLRNDPVTRAFHPAARLQAYGLGWFVSDFHGRTLVAHGGGIDGMSALVAWVPEEDLGVAILTNLQTPAPIWIYGILYAVLDPALAVGPTDWRTPYREIEAIFERLRTSAPRKTEGTRPSRSIDAYRGTYTAPTLGDARIAGEEEEEGTLVFRYGNLEGVLEHWHYDTFRVIWRDLAWHTLAGPGWITFRLDRSGAVEGLTLEAFPGEAEWLARSR